MYSCMTFVFVFVISGLAPHRYRPQQSPLPTRRNFNTTTPRSPLSSHKFAHNNVAMTSQPAAIENSDYDALMTLSERVVAAHFCQADDSSTCSVGEFVRNVASHLLASPLLTSYRELLQRETHLQGLLSARSCNQQPSNAFIQGVLEPLAHLRNAGQVRADMCVVIVDGLDEAEFHKPDYGDTIASFIAHHVTLLPPWLKFVVSVEPQFDDVTRLLPFIRLSLDPLARTGQPDVILVHLRAQPTRLPHRR